MVRLLFHIDVRFGGEGDEPDHCLPDTPDREIEAEIELADRIDLVLAFIRWTGICQLLPSLRRHVEANRKIRIITTTYTAALNSKH